MSSRLIAAILLAVALAPGAALAQKAKATTISAGEGEESADPQPEEGGETEGAEVVDQGDRVRMTEGATGKPTAPGEVHTVQKGDTLWDLSQRFLGSPWYWPKVWSYNPEIANPHWIYPGNLVRFFPAGDDVPTQVEVGTGPTTIDEGVEPGEMVAEDTDAVQVVGKIGYHPNKSATFNQVGFVTPKELDEAGKIDSSFSESEMLSFPDTAYIQFKNKSGAKVGDRYVIFRTIADVKHPVSGSKYGYMTKFLGTVRVQTVSDKLVTAAIENTWDEVNRGDLIGPFGEQLSKTVSLRANEKELKGYVIGTLVPFLSMVGEHHLVVLDRGSADGVQPGNTFTVTRQSNEGGEDFMNPSVEDTRYPKEDVATCMAVDVKEKATTCLLVRSLREIVWGDRVEMRPSGRGASPRASR
jgi:hypothetical protein